MNTEEKLEKLKDNYLEINPSLHLKQYGWEELYLKMDGQQNENPLHYWKKSFAFALAVIFLLVASLAGLFKVVQAAMPGDTLYPVKRLTERIAEKTTGNNQTAIDHRAEEIVGLTKKKQEDAQELKQVVVEYKEEVWQTKGEIEKSGKSNPEFERKLEEHHRQFEETVKEAPSSESEIKDAIKASETSKDSHED